MIAFFPRLHPDELFYSGCARYAALMAYPAANAVQLELFGAQRVKPAVELPSHLDEFTSRLPNGCKYTADRLIDLHTLLPYYSRFLTTGRVQEIRSTMKGSHSARPVGRTGARASKVAIPSRLQFCEECFRSDARLYGDAYWRRAHQLPGVLVCPTHGVGLTQSHVRRWKGGSFAFVDPRTAMGSDTHAVPVEGLKPEALVRLAKDSEWLLELDKADRDPKELAGRYRAHLVSAGWARPGRLRRLHATELRRAFIEYHGLALLERLGCALPEERNDLAHGDWLFRLLRFSKASSHPLHHLLVIHFLGLNAEEFFSDVDQTSSLNSRRTNRHFGSGDGSAIFDKVRVWFHEGVSLREMGRRLAIDSKCARRLCDELGLVRKGWNSRSHRLRTRIANTRRRHRDHLLALIKKHPEFNRRELSVRASAAMRWCGRYDRTWLMRHLPPRVTGEHRSPVVDWDARDTETLNAARLAVAALLQRSSPIRLTRTAIGREAGYLTTIEYYLRRLPRTKAYLVSVAESREAFERRRPNERR